MNQRSLKLAGRQWFESMRQVLDIEVPHRVGADHDDDAGACDVAALVRFEK